MNFFYWLPAYWLAGLLLYAVSPRQQFLQAASRKPPRAVALCVVVLVAAGSMMSLLSNGTDLVVALITVLAALMLCVPAPVFLLRHRPRWALSSTLLLALAAPVLSWLAE